MTKPETQYTTQTIKISENCTVTIRRPILTEAERAKAERSVISVLEQIGHKLV